MLFKRKVRTIVRNFTNDFWFLDFFVSSISKQIYGYTGTWIYGYTYQKKSDRNKQTQSL